MLTTLDQFQTTASLLLTTLDRCHAFSVYLVQSHQMLGSGLHRQAKMLPTGPVTHLM